MTLLYGLLTLERYSQTPCKTYFIREYFLRLKHNRLIFNIVPLDGYKIILMNIKQLVLSLLLFAPIFTFAQVEFGIKGGINSIDLVSNSIDINQGASNINLKFHGSSYGHHFGLYSRIKILGIYLEPSIIFNSDKVSYSLDQYSEGGVVSVIKDETYRKINIPMMVGIKAGIIRLFGGPVGHIHLDSSSELLDIKNYSQQFKQATYGYQAGFGLDIYKIRIEVAYEGNFSNFGDHITFNGNKYAFDDAASRIIGSVGYKF